jgi:hypothetical protein
MEMEVQLIPQMGDDNCKPINQCILYRSNASWDRPENRSRFGQDQETTMKKIVALAALALMLGASTGTTSASERMLVIASLPGSSTSISHDFTPVPGKRMAQQRPRCEAFNDGCFDVRGRFTCRCTSEARACGLC